MKKIIMVILLTLCLFGCEQKSELEKIMDKNNYIIVDVRTSSEFNGAHLVGAINIPYDKLESSNLDKSKDILVYCASGNRSSIAYEILTELGYKVYDLGGFNNINLPKE